MPRPWQQAPPPPITEWNYPLDPAEVVGGFVPRGPSIPAVPIPPEFIDRGPRHPVSPPFVPQGPSRPVDYGPVPIGPRNPVSGPFVPTGPRSPVHPVFARLVGEKVLERLMGVPMSRSYDDRRAQLARLLEALNRGNL